MSFVFSWLPLTRVCLFSRFHRCQLSKHLGSIGHLLLIDPPTGLPPTPQLHTVLLIPTDHPQHLLILPCLRYSLQAATPQSLLHLLLPSRRPIHFLESSLLLPFWIFGTILIRLISKILTLVNSPLQFAQALSSPLDFGRSRTLYHYLPFIQAHQFSHQRLYPTVHPMLKKRGCEGSECQLGLCLFGPHPLLPQVHLYWTGPLSYVGNLWLHPWERWDPPGHLLHHLQVNRRLLCSLHSLSEFRIESVQPAEHPYLPAWGWLHPISMGLQHFLLDSISAMHSAAQLAFYYRKCFSDHLSVLISCILTSTSIASPNLSSFVFS